LVQGRSRLIGPSEKRPGLTDTFPDGLTSGLNVGTAAPKAEKIVSVIEKVVFILKKIA